MLAPWTSLLDLEAAREATASIAKAVSKLPEVSPTIQSTLSGVFVATRDPTVPLAHLSTFLSRRVYSPFIEILSSPDILETKLNIEIGEKEVHDLLTDKSEDAIKLLTKLVQVSPSMSKTVTGVIEKDSSLWKESKNLTLARALLDSSSVDVLGESEETLAKTALKAAQAGSPEQRGVGRQILMLLPDHALVGRLLGEVDLSTFSSAFAELAQDMAKSGRAESSPSVRHLVQVALQRVARMCSAEGDLDIEDIELLISLGKSTHLSLGEYANGQNRLFSFFLIWSLR
jgi:hypothetical protein